MKWGILLRIESWRIGAHYSPINKRVCINLIPCCTVWIAAKSGIVPRQGLDIYRNDKGNT